VASLEGDNLVHVIFYYLKTGLIRGQAFSGSDLIIGQAFSGSDLIRGQAFSGSDLIRGGLLYYIILSVLYSVKIYSSMFPFIYFFYSTQ
jgi:hypothetical protein